MPSTSRERKRLLDALDAARAQGRADMSKWSTAAAKEAPGRRQQDARRRLPRPGNRDDGRLARQDRLGPTQAENILLGQAHRLAAEGRDREARAYAMAAAEHDAPGTARLVAELERAYRNGWPGHEEAAQQATEAEKKVAAWRIATASATAQIGRSAVAVATATGDLEATGRLSDEATVASISAKQAAFAQAQADGTPCSDPVGPTSPAGRAPGPVIGSGSSATLR